MINFFKRIGVVKIDYIHFSTIVQAFKDIINNMS